MDRFGSGSVIRLNRAASRPDLYKLILLAGAFRDRVRVDILRLCTPAVQPPAYFVIAALFRP